jgi:hypothetical protein
MGDVRELPHCPDDLAAPQVEPAACRPADIAGDRVPEGIREVPAGEQGPAPEDDVAVQHGLELPAAWLQPLVHGPLEAGDAEGAGKADLACGVLWVVVRDVHVAPLFAIHDHR